MVQSAESDDNFPDKDRSRLIMAPEHGEAEQHQRLQRLLRERAPWFDGGIREVGWATDIQFGHCLAHGFGRERTWLAGDAAHQTGPVGMQSMNCGLAEGTELASILTRILREGANPQLLEVYDSGRRGDWLQLLGVDGGPEPANDAPGWARANCARIPACIPASGPDLAALLGQLGLEWSNRSARAA
jgi:2-polyprenyl-6-methoxyphenol hydroxylase-like FAD-dependent oxidoreductase